MLKSKVYLKVKDYSVSNEEFGLLYNEEFDWLETEPKPSLEKLPDYYKSEDYISHTDSRRNLFERLYQTVKHFSLNQKVKHINFYDFEEKTLLDFGCGTGDFLHTAQLASWEVTGIEPNEKARNRANIKTGNSVYNLSKLEELKKKSFSVISLWHVLEHVSEPQELISTLKELLKDNGILIIAVPNYKSFDAEYYNEFWAAYDVPRHLWHFSRESLNRLFSKYDMVIEKTKPMLFDAFYVSLLSEKYKTKKMNFIKAFYVALQSNIKAKRSKEYSSVTYFIKKKQNTL